MTKKLTKISISIFLSLALFSCTSVPVSNQNLESSVRPTIQKVRDAVTVSEEFSSLSELENFVGFELNFPETFTIEEEKYTLRHIQFVENKFVQLVYKDEAEQNLILFRQGSYVNPLSMSGMDHEYVLQESLYVNDRMVNTFGVTDGFVLSTWNIDNSAYSLAISTPIPSGILYEVLKNFVNV